MQRRILFCFCAAALVGAAPVSWSLAEVPGTRTNGFVLLPNQWSLRPAGKQIVVGDFPVNIAIHPDGKYAAVLHSGNGPNEIIIIDIANEKSLSRAEIEESFYGVTFSPDGNSLLCSGAGSEVLHQFSFANGYLSNHREIKLRGVKRRGVPAGIAITSDGRQAYAANVWSHSISRVNLEKGKNTGELLLSTNSLLVQTNYLKTTQTVDEAAITKRAEAILDPSKGNEPFPYTCVLDEKRRRLYVSLWGQARIAVISTVAGEILDYWSVEEHPNEMLLARGGKLLYVANANRNTLTVLNTETGRIIETLTAELLPGSPPGSTPNSLALSPNEKTLFVANANINAIAVFDVSEPGKSHSLGFIPTGWYPTSVRVTPDGKKLLVANGKGIISKPNRNGPQPGKQPPASVVEYIASLFPGVISVIDLPKPSKFDEQMRAYTIETYACMPKTNHADITGNPIAVRAGEASPIKYCIYIVKENRTYDQVLGDMREGNGDPSLCIFPEHVTPNHHQLAREFVLLDNFYVESEVSADGHEWTMGAYATDFVEKTWPLTYGHNKHKKFPYPAEGNFPIATPAGGYLWDRAREAGVSYRSYGEFVSNGSTPTNAASSRVASLQGHFDPWFRGFDMDFPDSKRADRFISELKRFEGEGEMPRLQIVRLPNDHTSGTATNKPTPTAYLGDNDLALGRVIEAISHSKFWAQTAVFIVEDDAQNGPDHVDAHRTIAYVISPWTKRHAVDSTLYSTSSMLRTMELILGLKPMSQFDALALPMFQSFQTTPDLTPYTALPANVDLTAKNPITAWGSKKSQKMNFKKEDAADDLLLNDIIWRSVRGPDSPVPAPKRAAFVFAHPGKDDDD